MSPPVELPSVSSAATVPVVGQSAATSLPKNLDSSEKKEHAPKTPDHSARQVESVKGESPMVHLGYTVDHASHSLKIKVTNQVSGEVVREFELKGLGATHHEPLATKGVVVDDKT